MTDHPITPPEELVQQWASESLATQSLCNRAAQWGADQELEECCNIALTDPVCGTKHQRNMLVQHMRERRRPKPPSLKRVALLQLDTLNADLGLEDKGVDLSQIRRALEQLND